MIKIDLEIDWQGLTLGKGASDLSFFMSRGRDFGLVIDELDFISLYCKRFQHYSGNQTDVGEVLRQIHASNVFVSFMFWPHYLEGVPAKRVARIYEDMIISYKFL